MKYQCIDCKTKFSGERTVCPECRSRYIIFVEEKHEEHDAQPATRTEEELAAGEREQQDETQFETHAKLRSGDILRVNESVAVVRMEAGDFYKVASIKMDYYEQIYCLSACDEKGVMEEGGAREMPARSLDYWLDTDSIEVLERAEGISQET
jgi:DNA-directed RNA polymerase subunit RPC12/RpoP